MAKLSLSNNHRNNRGQNLLLLIFVLVVFCLGPLGFLAAEFAHYNLAQQELRGCVESAVLAGSATNASYDNSDIVTVQNAAMATALNMFKQNSVLGQSLANAIQMSNLPLEPAANQALIYFDFVDPTTNTAVPLGDPNGKTMRATAAFGFVPIFSKIGLAPTYPVIERSSGGLPKLDVILCFDISSSMDDTTPITLVDRYRTSLASGVTNSYAILPGAQGPLYQVVQATDPMGSSLNASIPQNLDTNIDTSPNNSLAIPESIYMFSPSNRGENIKQPANHLLLRTHGAPLSYTDLVVNIDGTSDFSQGVNVAGFNFPANNIGVLVEASRGNLESVAIADAAGVPWKKWGITPHANYFAAYLDLSLAQRNPIQYAITAAQNFFTVINNNSDARFGLITFSTIAGATDNILLYPWVPADYAPGYSGTSEPGLITDNPSTYVVNTVLNGVPIANTWPAPNPNYPLNPNNSNLTAITDPTNPIGISKLLAYGGTNIPDALDTAINQMKTSSRLGATKAIVLFTDGLPNMSGHPPIPPTTEADVLANTNTAHALSRIAAAQAAPLGIPIYCIGLCQTNGTLEASQNAILTDQNTDPSSGGIAGISGNGAQYFQTKNATELTSIFENVARSLVRLVH